MILKDERAFHSYFVKIARQQGWHIAQFRAARMQDGEWRTPVGADGKGYPDFTLVRERVLWAELKSEKGRLSVSQKVWIEKLRQTGAEVYVWRPSDLPAILDVLRPMSARLERLINASGGDALQAQGIERMLGEE